VLTVYIAVDGASDAIEFYRRAFGAVERQQLTVSESGPIGHAEIEIGDNVLFLADQYPPRGWLAPPNLDGRSSALVLSVDDCEAAISRAVAAGATLEREVGEQPGGRGGWVTDPFGHQWNIWTPG
jgi:PhnB protein